MLIYFNRQRRACRRVSAYNQGDATKHGQTEDLGKFEDIIRFRLCYRPGFWLCAENVSKFHGPFRVELVHLICVTNIGQYCAFLQTTDTHLMLLQFE